MPEFPRASDSNVLIGSPLCVMGAGATAGAVDTLVTANLAHGTAGVGVLGMGPLLYDGAAWNRALSPAADAVAGAGLSAGANMLYNGATWDRARSVSALGDGSAGSFMLPVGIWVNQGGSNWDRVREPGADTVGATGILSVGGMLWNGSSWDRPKSVAGVNNTTGTGLSGVAVMGFGGTNYTRVNINAAAVISAATQGGAILAAAPGDWSVTHTPAAAAQATASKAAGGAGVRHVARTICASYTSGAVVGAPILCHLRDGATGAGTIICSMHMAFDALNKVAQWSVSGLNFVGSANTAMTLEFAAAGAAQTNQSVSLGGYSTI